jgi:hypothetical protein
MKMQRERQSSELCESRLPAILTVALVLTDGVRANPQWQPDVLAVGGYSPLTIAPLPMGV